MTLSPAITTGCLLEFRVHLETYSYMIKFWYRVDSGSGAERLPLSTSRWVKNTSRLQHNVVTGILGDETNKARKAELASMPVRI